MSTLEPTTNSTMQMPTPPLATAVPSVTKVVEKRRSYPDMFLDMIQGPAITVIVGPGPFARQYTLPLNLLCAHSITLRNEVNRLVAENNRVVADNANKKRKLTPDTTDPSNETKTEPVPVPEFAIRLPDIDPFVFGLLLKYMYTGSYPQAVDGRPAPPAPNNLVANQAGSRAQQPILNQTGAAVYASHPANAPEAIPPSVHAYLLARRLGAIGFGNHAISRVYGGIGCYFAITPGLIDFIWRQKTPSHPVPAPGTATPAPSPSTPMAPASSHNPLRKLFLDALVQHWSSQHANIINKSAGLQRAWDQLFESHPDLRREFIFGLQGGVRVLRVQGYYTVSNVVAQGGAGPGPGAVHGNGMHRGSSQGIARGGGGVVKREKEEEGCEKMDVKEKEVNGAGKKEEKVAADGEKEMAADGDGGSKDSKKDGAGEAEHELGA